MTDYKDPLHVHPDEYTVFVDDKPVLTLNKRLLDQQNAWDNLDKLKLWHKRRLKTEKRLENATKEDIPDLLAAWTSIQFKLQAAWGFHENARFHRFWDIPACECPVMDNNDRYPTGYYVTSGGCPLHGGAE